MIRSSKKQTTVATSFSATEYVALSSAVSEVIWLAWVLEDLQLKKNSNEVRLKLHDSNTLKKIKEIGL